MSLLADFADQDSLDLVAHGSLTPEETKAKMISILAPHFTNTRIVEKFAVVLAPEAVNIRAIERDDRSNQLYLKIRNDYEKAESIDPGACYEGCRTWEQKIQDGIAEYWSALRLDVDLTSLGINDFKFEAFRIIGLLVEAVMQPALRELLFQARLGARKRAVEEEIGRLDLGLVIDELARDFSYASFLAPAPWNVKINQWRNMAHHFSTRVQGDRIVGVYGKGRHKHELQVTRQELFAAVITIHAASRALKTARTIFIIDRMEKIGFQPNTLEVRNEVKLLHLESAFATQGFELVRFEMTPSAVDATVRDVTDQPRRTRMIHSSQFVYPIWLEFPSSMIRVTYWDTNGELLMISSARGPDCEEIADGKIPFSELANRVQFHLTAAGRATPC
jgi:hypothetical protein